MSNRCFSTTNNMSGIGWIASLKLTGKKRFNHQPHNFHSPLSIFCPLWRFPELRKHQMDHIYVCLTPSSSKVPKVDRTLDRPHIHILRFISILTSSIRLINRFFPWFRWYFNVFLTKIRREVKHFVFHNLEFIFMVFHFLGEFEESWLSVLQYFFLSGV